MILHILFQSVRKVLESPNSWEAFRRAGGFTGLLSLVTDMEGALSDPPKGEVWRSIGHQPVLDFLFLTLHILALSVHLHTVNSHHFQDRGLYERLAEALLQLGCFNTECPENRTWDAENSYCPMTTENNQSPEKSFHQFVELAQAPVTPSCTNTASQPNPDLPVTLRTCIRLMSYLDQFATGTYSPLELNLGSEDGYDGDTEKQYGPTGHEGAHFESSAVYSSPADDTQGRQRKTATSISTVCSESQYR